MSSGLRFSNGSDPEPWRCRRTDGKKWRCAKDVAPNQKYCERHAHKTRSRSRKPVEIKVSHHNLSCKSTKQVISINKNIFLWCVSYYGCDQWRCNNGATATPMSQMNNQFHFQPSVKKDQIYKQGNHEYKRSYIDTSEAATGARRKDFIDAWSRISGGDRDDCSLTLSMQSGGNGNNNGIEFDQESFEMAVGMLNCDGGMCGDVFKPDHEWLNHGSWAGSAPGWVKLCVWELVILKIWSKMIVRLPTAARLIVYVR